MARQRLGNRRHFATAYQHNGTLNQHGMPAYDDSTAWNRVVTRWPCELLTANGGETIRGRQVTATTTHVLIGEYFGGNGIKPEHRVEVNGQTYAVVAGYDADGDNREYRVEMRLEV